MNINSTSFTSSGAGTDSTDITEIPEKVHVVIVNREPINEKWMFSSAATKNNETCDNTNQLIIKIFNDSKVDKETIKVFKEKSYNFDNYHAEIFLPIVFRRFKTIRSTNTMVQAGFPKEEHEGTRFQYDMAIKRKILESNAYMCGKLAYMLYYQSPVPEYNRDMEEHKRSYEDDATPPDYMKLKYRAIVQKSNYGMWGKWYDGINGWHRGIDMCYDVDSNINCPIYAIASGYVVRKSHGLPHSEGNGNGKVSYLSVYNPQKDVTVVYMHMTIDSDILDVNYELPYDQQQYISAGTKIGIQDSRGAVGIHTHVEFNKGEYTGSCPRPWSDDDGVKDQYKKHNNVYGICNDYKVDSNDAFSLNPYPIINRLWYERKSDMQM